MNHVFFYVKWMAGCVRIAYLGKSGYQNALWEEANLPRQCGRFGILQLETSGPLMHATHLSLVIDHVTFLQKWYSLMSVAVANVPCPKAKMVQEIFEKHNNEFEALTWPPQISIQFPSMGFAVQTNPILGGILEPDTTADLQGMESVPRQIRAALAKKRD